MDGADSTEVWGAFRAARRARVTDLATCTAHGGVLTIEAAHDGYRHLHGRPIHRRRWLLTEAGLRVEDYITGRGRHAIALRWHLVPGAGLRLAGAGAVVTTPAGEFRVIVSATGPITLAVETGQVALGLARTVRAPVLVCRVTTRLPVQISTSWQQAPRARAGQPRAHRPERRDHRSGEPGEADCAATGGRPGRGARRALPGAR